MARGGVKHLVEEDERARAAWLLAVDLADEAAGGGFLKIYEMPGKRGRGSAEAITMPRRIALYLAAIAGNVPSRALAKAANVHWTTVAHHLEKVEDLREADQGLDELLDGLAKRLLFRGAALAMAGLRYEVPEGTA